MGRDLCCEKMGLNNKRLMAYIYQYGHANWLSLPKQAGLLRCGKSCRLRWINYLRPEIKRGNFTADEEKTLIKLLASVGNKFQLRHWLSMGIKTLVIHGNCRVEDLRLKTHQGHFQELCHC